MSERISSEFWSRHGHSPESGVSREYESWASMKRRCLNPKNKTFERYGGRGILICKRWLEFKHFIADMGLKPSTGHSLDRIDNNSHYMPSNCQWATIKQQSVNKRSTIRISFNGKTQALKEWARELGMCGETLRCRLKRGWSVEHTLSAAPYFVPYNKR